MVNMVDVCTRIPPLRSSVAARVQIPATCVCCIYSIKSAQLQPAKCTKIPRTIIETKDQDWKNELSMTG